jgi:predicted nuclease of predicted toxin-antitoxin system
MRILADENVAGSVVRALIASGHDVTWIAELAPGSTDSEVLKNAVAEKRLLLTHDKEFAAKAARQPISALTGVILLRLDGIDARDVAGFITKTINSRDDWTGNSIVLKPKSIRMRKLR